MDMNSFVSNGAFVGAPKNPGPAVFYARVGSASPSDPSVEQIITDRPTSWTDTIQNVSKSALTFVVRGASAPAQLSSGLAGKAATEAGFEAKKIQGEIGKVYYGAVTTVTGAVSKGAAVAQSAAKTIKYGSLAVLVIIGIVLFAEFRIAAKGV